MTTSKEIGVGAFQAPSPVHETLPNFIFLSGKMGTGKSTVGEMLVDALRDMYKCNTARIAFGDVVKKEIAKTFDIPLKDFYEDKNKVVEVGTFYHDSAPVVPPKTQMSLRELMQWYGTDWSHAVRGQTYWVQQLHNEVSSFSIPVNWVVVDDLRFPHEATYATEVSGYKVRLQPHHKWIPGPFASHLSETALDAYHRWDLMFTPKYSETALEEVASCILNYIQMFPKCCTYMRVPSLGTREVPLTCR